MATRPLEEIAEEYYQGGAGTQTSEGISPWSWEQPEKKKSGNTGVNLIKGIGKSVVSTATEMSSLGERGLRKVLPKKAENFLLGEKQEKTAAESLFPEKLRVAEGGAQKVGKFVGDVAQFAVPGTKVSKATSALKTVPRIASRAAAAGGIGVAQTGDLGAGAVAAATEAVVPGASKVAGFVAKPVTALMGRLLRGVGSGLSGASSAQIKAILENPSAAKKFVGEIRNAGGSNLLRKEAATIVNGVSGIKKKARAAFGEGLEQLSQVDIKPDVFRENVSGVLNRFGSVKRGTKRILQNVEFDDPKHLRKASDLIDRLSIVDLDGKSLRKLADDIASTKYKIATSDERLAFNAFLGELENGLKGSISKSTNKLDEINSAFSQDMQLAEEIEKIFGKVKFKNAREILGVSQRLESLFNQKGLAPEAVDRFLRKIGIDPSEFRAGESARQMGELSEKANSIGTNPLEIIRSFTAAIVPPQAVRELAIITGMSRNAIQEIATKLSPTVRAILVRSLLGEKGPQPDQENNY